MNNPILVWRFYKAPQEYQNLSDNGGDEDWLAFVPAEYSDDYLGWLEHGSFGVCSIDKYDLPNGDSVYIGSHA